MTTRFTSVLAGAVLVSMVLGGSAALAPARAAPAHGAVPGTESPLRLTADKPIIHLGEDVLLSGTHFTPGATVTVSLHGPFSATIGKAYGRLTVDEQGRFVMRIHVAGYPDAEARADHTIILAASSSASLGGMREGAAVTVQADPMPSTEIITRGRLGRTLLVIDGFPVRPEVTPRGTLHYRISYAGHLRAGAHSAYVKWNDASGAYGARSWRFRTGSPREVSAVPALHLDRPSLHLGQAALLLGSGFTPGATIVIALGGMNTPPSSGYGHVLADASGRFTLPLRVASYPDANARQSGMVAINAVASGAAVGDLPEGVAILAKLAR